MKLSQSLNMQTAIAAFNDPKNELSRRQLAAKHGVFYLTLKDRLRSVLPKTQTHQSAQKLTVETENQLFNYCMILISQGFDLRICFMRQLAMEILQRRSFSVFSAFSAFSKFSAFSAFSAFPAFSASIGKNWTQRFLQRRPELATIWNQPLTIKRITAQDWLKIKQWFARLEEIIKIDHIQLTDIYNMNEKKWIFGHAESVRVIVSSVHKQIEKMIEHAGNKNSATAVECVFADGFVLSSLIIFKDKLINANWNVKKFKHSKNFIITVSKSDYISSVFNHSWLKDVFNKHIHARIQNRPRLFLIDGHNSHIIIDFIEYACANNIQLFCLFNHITHLMQSLNVDLFRPLQQYYNQMVDEKSKHGTTYINKFNFLQTFHLVRIKTYIKSNINLVFINAKIFSADVNKIFIQLFKSNADQSEQLSATPSLRKHLEFIKTPRNVQEINQIIDVLFEWADLSSNLV